MTIEVNTCYEIHDCYENIVTKSTMNSVPDEPIVAIIKQTLLNKIVEFPVQLNDKDKQWTVRRLYATRSKDNFASVLYVAELTDSNIGKLLVSLIVKVLPDDPVMRTLQNSDKQFSNEKNMFLNAVPVLLSHSRLRDPQRISSLFPKCHYADCDPINAMIIMENLQLQHFQLADLLLDYDHCKISLQGLARFHALSYGMKHREGQAFKEKVVQHFQEARYCDVNRRWQNAYMRYTSMDPVNFILKSDDSEWITFRNGNLSFLKRLEAMFENSVDLLMKSVIPVEPLAVLCHGDFNRNNIMFRYEKQKPVQIKLIDFQTVRYANPATDITFLFYLNTTAELRSRHLDELLSAYQKTVVDTLVEMDVAPRAQLESVYSFEAFKEDYERYALNGYVISAMFNHFMLASIEEAEQLGQMRTLEADLEEPSEAYLLRCVSLGGEEAMRRSTAIIKELALMKHCFDIE